MPSSRALLYDIGPVARLLLHDRHISPACAANVRAAAHRPRGRGRFRHALHSPVAVHGFRGYYADTRMCVRALSALAPRASITAPTAATWPPSVAGCVTRCIAVRRRRWRRSAEELLAYVAGYLHVDVGKAWVWPALDDPAAAGPASFSASPLPSRGACRDHDHAGRPAPVLACTGCDQLLGAHEALLSEQAVSILHRGVGVSVGVDGDAPLAAVFFAMASSVSRNSIASII
ncbi:MAG: hypothetical protein M1826_007074 [Phylliscum demangeonii]|nr:MAG: hypothetical protein M1826_007074 [Phylliscum demangeonii]